MKRLIVVISIGLMSFVMGVSNVLAVGTATEIIGGNDAVTVGTIVSITVKVNNESGSNISAYQGAISYDEEYFEFVSFTADACFSLSFNSANGRFIGVDMTGGQNSIKEYGNLFTLSLLAKKEGETTISTVKSAFGDSFGNVIPKTVTAPKAINIIAVSDKEEIGAISLEETVKPAENIEYTKTIEMTKEITNKIENVGKVSSKESKTLEEITSDSDVEMETEIENKVSEDVKVSKLQKFKKSVISFFKKLFG